MALMEFIALKVPKNNYDHWYTKLNYIFQVFLLMFLKALLLDFLYMMSCITLLAVYR